MRYILPLLLVLAFSSGVSGQNTKDPLIVLKEVSDDSKYGYKPKKNIKVGSISNEYVYVAQLTGPNGEQIQANRRGSCCAVKSKNAPFGMASLDIWEIRYEGLEEPIVIYINGYDFDDPRCPVGLKFKPL